jgi:hypothetical protein
MTSIFFTYMTMVLLAACGSDEEPDASDDLQGGDIDVSVVATKFYHIDNVNVSIGESTITITSTNQPDHKSAYYATSNALYEAYEDTSNPDFRLNPNNIVAQNLVFKIPRYPAEASNKASTSLGPMGVSINSVVFFNQNAGPGDDILEELNTFDQYTGHPQQQGQYHYHIKPTWLTELKGSDAFLGFLLDGFPVYGPEENGKTLTNDDLDAYHGHSAATTDFPDGIYHYHITEEYPWINGGQYFGNAGTFTN